VSHKHSYAILHALIACAILAAVRASAETAPGRYTVGVTTLTFTKTSVSTSQPRPLTTLIWYPAVPGTGSEEPLGQRDAEVVAKQFPWLVFSHGSCGLPSESSYLTMALASRGFVVAAPAHLGNTRDYPGCFLAQNFLDSLQNRVPDVRFIVDSMLAESADQSSRFADRLRADAIGIAGLSFGGYTTLVAAQRDPRFSAALVMVPGGVDVIDANDIAIPTMIIGAELDHIVGYADSEKAYRRVAGPRFLIELLKADHLSVTDECTPLCSPEGIPQDAAHRIIVRSASAFFRHYLLHDHAGGMGSIRPMPRSILTAEPWRPPPTATPGD
jgi:predicted dienelactone hydrolase